MTDKELLELAAKAAGFTLEEHYDDDQYYPWCTETHAFWNPLADDGDALRLAVKLNLDVVFWVGFVTAEYEREMYKDDPYAATRRAIVRAAAEIGRSHD
jgi:hypothetical protein